MKGWWLLTAGFKRHRLRLVLTVLSILVAFVLFGFLVAIRQALSAGVDVADAERLVVRHKVSIVQTLPASYEADMERVDGVVAATPQVWFGGIYQDPRNFFAQMPVKPREFMDMFPEYLLPEDQMDAWLKTRTGAIVGQATAEKFGWEVGDRIPIQATIWMPKDGGETWEFDLVGIYEGAEKGTDDTQFFFRYDYFDETRRFGEGQVGWYTLRVGDSARAAAIAEQVDAIFANSPAETKTETEGAFVQGFADQVGNIGAIMTAILSAVFFTILLVVGNTMAQSVRERTQELGVLKAIGFSDGQVLALVLGESMTISLVGGGLGLALGWLAVSGGGDPTGGLLPMFFYPQSALALGIALVLGLGLVTGLLPALAAMSLRPADALRRGA